MATRLTREQVRANVLRMAEAGASEDEIDSYVSIARPQIVDIGGPPRGGGRGTGWKPGVADERLRTVQEPLERAAKVLQDFGADKDALTRGATAAGAMGLETVAHPIDTGTEIAMMPVRSGARLLKYASQQEDSPSLSGQAALAQYGDGAAVTSEQRALSKRLLDVALPETEHGRDVTGKEAAFSAAQLASLALSGPITQGSRRVLQMAKVPQAVGSRVAGALAHAPAAATVGATYDTEDPARGAVATGLLGMAIGGARGDNLGARVRRDQAGANLAEHPDRLLTARQRPTAQATAEPMPAPEAPFDAPESIIMTLRKAQAERATPASAEAAPAPQPRPIPPADPTSPFTPSERLVVRTGAIEANGGYFQRPGVGQYVDPYAKGVVPYDLADVRLADMGDKNTVANILSIALRRPNLTPEQQQAIQQLMAEPDVPFIDQTTLDATPVIVEAAKLRGYDGIQVFAPDDVAQPSSVFVWNIRKLKQGALPSEPIPEPAVGKKPAAAAEDAAPQMADVERAIAEIGAQRDALPAEDAQRPALEARLRVLEVTRRNLSGEPEPSVVAPASVATLERAPETAAPTPAQPAEPSAVGDVADGVRPGLASTEGAGDRASGGAAQAGQHDLASRPAVAGAAGRSSEVFFSDGKKLKTTYRVVDAADLQASHDPATGFQPNPRYPEGVQGRAYHGKQGTAARQQVELATGTMRPEVVLDAGSGISDGPPLVTSHGIVVAGNQRAMMLKGAASQHPEVYAKYRAELEKRASQFDVTPEAIAGMTSPVLVRQIADESVDVNDPAQLAALNQLSDQTATKTKDQVSAAMSRAKVMRSATDAINHLATTMDPDESMADYLSGPSGREFVRALTRDGVLSTQELPKFLNPTTTVLTDEGKLALEDMLYAAAIGDGDTMAKMPKWVRVKLKQSIPSLIVSGEAGPYSLQPELQQAIDLLFQVDARKAVRTREKMQGLLRDNIPNAEFGVTHFLREDADKPAQLFASEQDWDSESNGVRLAQFIETKSGVEIAESMREYAKLALSASSRSQSADMFGEEPASPDELRDRIFRWQQRVAENTPSYGDRLPFAKENFAAIRTDKGIFRGADHDAAWKTAKEAGASVAPGQWKDAQGFVLKDGTTFVTRAEATKIFFDARQGLSRDRSEFKGVAPEQLHSQDLKDHEDFLPDDEGTIKETDLFGYNEPAKPKKHAGQESMFGAKEGTAESRSLKQTERAARAELDKLKQQMAVTTSPVETVKIAKRIAELEKLTNRGQAISAKELATRAKAESAAPDYRAMSDDEFFAATGGLDNPDEAVHAEVYRRIDANKAKRDQRSVVESPIRTEILRRLAGEEDFESLKQESTAELIRFARDADILSASELAALERQQLGAGEQGKLLETSPAYQDQLDLFRKAVANPEGPEAKQVSREETTIAFGSEAKRDAALAEHQDWFPVGEKRLGTVPSVAERRAAVVAAKAERHSVDVRGTVLRDGEAFAGFAEMARDPQLEQFGVVFLKPTEFAHHIGEVVAHHLSTVGALDFVQIGRGGEAGLREWVARNIVAPAKRFGVTKVGLHHNHPSGVSDASGADVGVTADIAAFAREAGIEVVGHVVTDHGTYSWIEVEKNLVTPHNGLRLRPNTKFRSTGMDQPKINTAAGFAEVVGDALDPKATTFVFVDTQMRAVAYEPRATVDVAALPQWIAARLRSLGARAVFIAAPRQMATDLQAALARAHRDNEPWRTDVVDILPVQADGSVDLNASFRHTTPYAWNSRTHRASDLARSGRPARHVGERSDEGGDGPNGQRLAPLRGAKGTIAEREGVAEEEGSEYTTGIKNAASARDRAEMGLGERERPEPRTQEEMYEAGKALADADPGAMDRLVKALRDDPERIVGTKEEAGLLLKRRVDLDRTLRLLDAEKDKAVAAQDHEAEATARQQLAEHRETIREFVGLVERTGTATARALSARRMMSKLDYSLSNMESLAEAAKSAPLTDDELGRVKALYEEMQEKLESVQADLAGATERAAIAEADLHHAELRAEAMAPLTDRVARRLDAAAEAAKARIRARGFRAAAGLDPTELADYALLGAAEIAKGAVRFADWSARMAEAFGDHVQPHLKEIFEASNTKLNQELEAEKTEEARASGVPGTKAGTRKRTAKTPADIRERMAERIEAGIDAVSDLRLYLRVLALNYIRGGVTAREKLLTALTEDVNEAGLDATKNKVRDALSGYGQFKAIDRARDKTRLREIQAESQKLAQLEALQKGQAPLASGFERQAPTDEIRRLTQQVNEAKKKAGIGGQDAAGRLKSALAAAKTRTRNAIKDLQSEIDTGARIVAGKTVLVGDAELEALRTQLADLRKIEEQVFKKPGLTDAERLTLAIRAASRATASWQTRLEQARKGVFGTGTKGKPVSSPALAAMRAQAKAAREEYNELKSLDPAQQVEATTKRMAAATKAAEANLRHWEEQVAQAEKGLFVSGKKSQPLSGPALDALRAKVDAAKAKYEELAATDPALQQQRTAKANQQYRTRLARQEADLLDRMARGDFAPRKKKVGSQLDSESLRRRTEVESVKRRWKQELDRFEKASRSPGKKVWDAVAAAPGTIKSIKASLDMSMIFRQGLRPMITHPRTWLRNSLQSFVDAAQTFGGKEVMDAVRADLASRTNADLYQRAKLAVSAAEEAFPTALPERIPGIGRAFKASNVAFTAFQYRTRADIFDTLIDLARASGVDVADTVQLQSIGKVVNSLTGRSQFGKHEGTATLLNDWFFAPRNVKAHLDVLTAHVFDPTMSRFGRQQAAKNLVKIMAAMAAIMVISNALHPESAETDPRDSDFGQIAVNQKHIRAWMVILAESLGVSTSTYQGKTRFDFTGGLRSWVTLVSRMASKLATGRTSEQGSPRTTAADVAANFFGNKLSPTGTVIRDRLRGKTFEGDKPSVLGDAVNLLVPMILQTAIEAVAQERTGSSGRSTSLVNQIRRAIRPPAEATGTPGIITQMRRAISAR